MRESTLLAAVRAAERFLESAEAARLRIASDGMLLITGCKETAEVKRASMDLSRALSEMRRPL